MILWQDRYAQGRPNYSFSKDTCGRMDTSNPRFGAKYFLLRL